MPLLGKRSNVEPPPAELTPRSLDLLQPVIGLPTAGHVLNVPVEVDTHGFVPTCRGLLACGPFDLSTVDLLAGQLDADRVRDNEQIAAERSLAPAFERALELLEARRTQADPIDGIEEVVAAVTRCLELPALDYRCEAGVRDAAVQVFIEVDDAIDGGGLIADIGQYVTCDNPTVPRCERFLTPIRAHVADVSKEIVGAVVMGTQRTPFVNQDDALNAPDWVWMPLAPITRAADLLGVAYPDYYPLYFQASLLLPDTTDLPLGATCEIVECNTFGEDMARVSSVDRKDKCVGGAGQEQSGNPAYALQNPGTYSDCWQVVSLIASARPRLVPYGAGQWQEWMFHSVVFASKDLDDNGSYDSLGMTHTGYNTALVLPQNRTPSTAFSSYWASTYSYMIDPEGRTYNECQWGAPGVSGMQSPRVVSGENGGFTATFVTEMKQFFGRQSLIGTPYTDCHGAKQSDMQLTYFDTMTILWAFPDTAPAISMNANFVHAVGNWKYRVY